MSENQQNNNNQIAGALTYPSRSEDNAEPLPQQPRQPRSFQGLLRFAMEATKAEDAPGNSSLAPMDEERRKFLEEALKYLTVDMAEIFHLAIKTLSNEERIRRIPPGDTLPDDIWKAFNNIIELIDDIDVSNDFYKMGGFSIFFVCFGSENEKVRALTARILGELCQNNPFCQARALENGLINILLTLVEADTGEALAKELYALSCACREFEPSCRKLLSSRGCEVLAPLLQAEDLAARTKAAFFIRYLCQHYPEAKEKFINLNIIKSIAAQIKKGRDSASEHLLSTILALLEKRNSTIIQQCSNADLGLRDIILDHLQLIEADDSLKEEKEYCCELLEILNKCTPDGNLLEEVDR